MRLEFLALHRHLWVPDHLEYPENLVPLVFLGLLLHRLVLDHLEYPEDPDHPEYLEVLLPPVFLVILLVPVHLGFLEDPARLGFLVLHQHPWDRDLLEYLEGPVHPGSLELRHPIPGIPCSPCGPFPAVLA